VNKTDQNGEFDNIFSISEQQLLDLLGSSSQGLEINEIADRKNRYGKNVIRDLVHIRGIFLFLKQFNSPLILILVAAAILSIFLDQWLDALIILAVVSGSALIGYRQEFNAQEAIEKLKESIAHRSIVRRDGKESDILSSDIVPGDIVLLKAGSMIPADGRIIKARDLHVNESAMTGESFPVEKVPCTIQPDVPITQMNNAVFMGT